MIATRLTPASHRTYAQPTHGEIRILKAMRVRAHREFRRFFGETPLPSREAHMIR